MLKVTIHMKTRLNYNEKSILIIIKILDGIINKMVEFANLKMEL